jgi:hypothetical protein
MKAITLFGFALLVLACGPRKNEAMQAAQHQAAKASESSTAEKAPAKRASKSAQARRASPGRLAKVEATDDCGPAWYSAHPNVPLAVRASHEKGCGR